MGRGDSRPRGLRILVTGAAGFIGSHLCERLVADGHGVWGLDNFDPDCDPPAKRRNLAAVADDPCMHVIAGDVRDGVLLDGLMTSVPFDVVMHLAARTGERASLAHPDLCWDVNVTGTLRLLEAMRRHHVSRLIFASSAAVYGHGTRETAVAETDRAVGALSPYGASKRAAELLCRTWHHCWGFSVHSLRLFDVYGPRQRPDQEIAEISHSLVTGEWLTIHGEGDTPRDCTYVDDVIEGICRSAAALRERSAGAPACEVYNLGRGHPVSLTHLVETLSSALETSIRVRHRPARPGASRHLLADVARATATLGYSPGTDLADGIDRYIAWLSAQDPERVSPETVVLSR